MCEMKKTLRKHLANIFFILVQELARAGTRISLGGRYPCTAPEQRRNITRLNHIMGGGISMETAQKVLAPTAGKRAGKHRRRVKIESNDYMLLILERFDKSKTGSLMRNEVKELCTTIMNEVTPLLGKKRCHSQ